MKDTTPIRDRLAQGFDRFASANREFLLSLRALKPLIHEFVRELAKRPGRAGDAVPVGRLPKSNRPRR